MSNPLADLILKDEDGAVIADELIDTHYGLRFQVTNHTTGATVCFVRPEIPPEGENKTRVFDHPRIGKVYFEWKN